MFLLYNNLAITIRSYVNCAQNTSTASLRDLEI